MSGPGHAHSFLNSSVQVGAFECPNFPRPSLCRGWVGCSLLCLKCNCSPPVVAGCYSFILLGLCNIPAAFPTLSFKLVETNKYLYQPCRWPRRGQNTDTQFFVSEDCFGFSGTRNQAPIPQATFVGTTAKLRREVGQAGGKSHKSFLPF